MKLIKSDSRLSPKNKKINNNKKCIKVDHKME